MILELFNNYRNELIILAWLSAALLLVSIAVIPWIVIKIPEDYFHERYRVRVSKNSSHPLFTQILTGLKNLIALFLLYLASSCWYYLVKEYSQYLWAYF